MLRGNWYHPELMVLTTVNCSWGMLRERVEYARAEVELNWWRKSRLEDAGISKIEAR
jgi:hypothetical protein